MKTANGWTLIELITTLTILVLIAGFAWPSFQALHNHILEDNTRNTWIQLMNFSRRSAVDRQATITFCPFDEQTQQCTKAASTLWAIFTDQNTNQQIDYDDELLRVHYPNKKLSYWFYPNNRPYLRFSNKTDGIYSGVMRGLTLCPHGQPDSTSVHLKVNIMGRVAASQSRDAAGIILRESGKATYPIQC